MSSLDRPPTPPEAAPGRQDAAPTPPEAASRPPEGGGAEAGSPDAAEAAGSPASTRATVGKAALIILAATVVGRVFGLVRDMAVAHFFGANATTDAFFLAYKIPYLLSLTVGGALTATFIPVFTQRMVTGRREEGWKLTVSMTNTVAVVLAGLTAALMVLAPWVVPLFGPGFNPSTMGLAVSLFRILMPGVVFAGLAGLATGVLNSLKGFSVPAFSASVGAVVTIAFMALFSRSWGVTSLAVGTTAGAAATFLVLVPQLRSKGLRYTPRIDWRLPGMSQVALMVWPILIGSAVGKVSIFVDQVLGSLLGEGSISALNYSEKLFQLPLGLFVAGITIPIFPLLSEQVAARRPDRVNATLAFALRLIAFVIVPASVGLIVLRVPIVALLFQNGGKFTADDTARTAWALLMYSIGLYSYAGRDTLTRVFYAYHDTRTPVTISVIAVGINIVCSYVLMQFIGVGGLALGTTIALTVNYVVLGELMRRRLGFVGFGGVARSLARVVGASVVMGVVVWAIDLVLADSLGAGTLGMGLRVLCGVVGGAAAYLAVAAVGRLPELREVLDMLKSVTGRARPGEDNSSLRRT
jgi:putative peptidoglycan lipid II flippase